MKIVVTGGLGFIGSHTAVELIAGGHEVILVDNLSNTRIEVLDGIETISGVRPIFEELDMANQGDVDLLCSKYTFDGCIHFAAFKAVGESVAKPLEYYNNNIASLVYLLQNFRDQGHNNIIFSSSCTVYGQADEMPITEDAPIKPAESPYGNTKQIGEEIIQEAIAAHPELKAIALRYFNPIGAHETANIGELPIGVPQNLIPFVTQTAAGIRKELSVFGNDYPTKDGTAVRDYIHVVDLAKAHIAALERLLKNNNKKDFEVFNVGTGTGSSVLEVIQAFEKVSKIKLNYKIVDRREGDITSAYADTTLAKVELGWKTEKTLDEALLAAWQWQLKQ